MEPRITPEVYTSMGLTDEEYALLVKLHGREPTYTELGMFAVMWSEHCGYKYSRPVLALFKKYREALEGEGLENAGIVDLGDGLAVTMKIESHNHPSAVEPYQGAATGVGGIIRDILTMGARPIASLNSLRFGTIGGDREAPETVARNRYLFEHVVAGIAGYGNCVGVPTVAGEVAFHPRYSGNPLVNAMCVGILRKEEIATAAAKGVGNPVVYLGSATGKDGIHGATFASDALGEDNDAKRPNVQIGDPLAEKLLIEATLEALRTGAIVAIQDMGAAGLTCSTVEMSSKGGVGMRVDLDLVPMREPDMTAYELMLSESQERMLAVVERGREEEVLRVFRKWGVHGVVIGEVTDDGLVTVLRGGKVEARLDPKLLTDACPTYQAPLQVPEYHERALRFRPQGYESADPDQALRRLLASPNIASKRWVFEQYDQQVQTQTAVLPGGGDAAVIAPRGTRKAIALKTDGNGLQTYLHPRAGGQLAVAEAARNVACAGALPVAVTDGLNFGNPQRPHVFWQFSEAVRGIAEACDTLDTPVISGNVSFYNESDLGEVLPTPVIGMLGILEDRDAALRMAPKAACGLWLIDYPVDLGPQMGLGASEFLATVMGLEDGVPVAPDLEAEKRLCRLLADLAHSRTILSAHDCSEGGLAVALAEVAISGERGIEADVPSEGLPDVAALFGEWPGRVLVGVSADKESELKSATEAAGLRCRRIGSFGLPETVLVRVEGRERVCATVAELSEAYHGSLPSLLMDDPKGSV
ncbi:MAG TPA: phosphoribosylformylglycinamidine synthase subunit PurL [Armatimonadetes bacterium]|nr:phosphoribosylformylglycinamidine synthase subunit PurL [Armatimonadota bacterium]